MVEIHDLHRQLQNLLAAVSIESNASELEVEEAADVSLAVRSRCLASRCAGVTMRAHVPQGKEEEPTMTRPTPKQELILRQFITASHVDRVARLV